MDIYFHADDAGIDCEVTRQLIECWEEDMIDGFSVLANGTCNELIKEAFERNVLKNINLSVHLNLSDGKSLGEYKDTYMLANSNCYFNFGIVKMLFSLFYNRKKKEIFLSQVYSEWERQILAVKKIAGEQRRLVSLDGHNHIHMFPPFFVIAKELAEKHAIKKVRVSKEFFFIERVTDLFKIYYLSNCVKRIVLWILAGINSMNKIKFTPKADAVIGIQYSGHMLVEKVKAGIEKSTRKKAQSIEIIFHPGRASYNGTNNFTSNRSARKFFLSDWRVKEYEAIKKLRNEFSGTCENN